eukprot:scpid29043/ scgid15404/ Protein DVR-1; Vegetal hemisphere VG1 protein
MATKMLRWRGASSFSRHLRGLQPVIVLSSCTAACLLLFTLCSLMPCSHGTDVGTHARGDQQRTSSKNDGGTGSASRRHHLHQNTGVADMHQVPSDRKRLKRDASNEDDADADELAPTAVTTPDQRQPPTLSRQKTNKLVARLLRMFGMRREPYGLTGTGAQKQRPRIPAFMRDAFKQLNAFSPFQEKISLCFDKDQRRSLEGEMFIRFKLNLGVKRQDLPKVTIHRAELHLFRKATYKSTEPSTGRGNLVVEVQGKDKTTGSFYWHTPRDRFSGFAFNLSAPLVRINITQLVLSWKDTLPKRVIIFRIRTRAVTHFTFAKEGEGDRAQLLVMSTVYDGTHRRGNGVESLDVPDGELDALNAQRVETVAAWSTLNKSTETWEYEYRPPNALTNESLSVHRPLLRANATDDLPPVPTQHPRTAHSNRTLADFAGEQPSYLDAVPQRKEWLEVGQDLGDTLPLPSRGQITVGRRKKRAKSHTHSATGHGKSSNSSSVPGDQHDNAAATRQRKRSKRAAAPKRPLLTLQQQSRTACHLERLVVDLKQLAWDRWVIAPRRFNLGYCVGMCPWPLHHYNPSPHAILRTLLSLRDPDYVPAASCVPTKMAPVKLMYRDDDDSVVISSFPGLEAVECGCR